MTIFQDQDKCHNGKVSKVDRYGWEVRDEPGRMRMISKYDLDIDYTYQRDGNEAKVNVIARDWSWLACGVITVAERGGKRFVVDGQHRVLAALKRSDIDTMPCIVFKSHGVKEEATGFLVAQTMRKPVSATEKFRALVAIGDPVAIAVKDLVETSGRTVEKWAGSSTVNCAGAMLKLMRDDGKYLRRVWPLIMSICTGKAMPQIIVRCMVYIERRMPEGTSLTDSVWSKRLLKIGADEICAAANRSAAYHGSANITSWSTGVVEAINKGHRIHLPLIK